MNKTLVLSIAATAFSMNFISAQKGDPVLMKINGTPVTISEFEYIYKKNNPETTSDKKNLDDYLNLFVNYKLKVEEAKTQKLDTTKAFKKEYDNYKAQLAEPYLKDTIAEDALARKYYERLSENIEVSHILIPFNKQRILPSDTLACYNKAMEVWKKITATTNPLPFQQAAAEYSADKNAERPGYLGWVTANALVAPFEDAMFALKPGEISKPVRTNFGYHLILVHNRRPDLGQHRVAHIMFASQPNMTSQQTDSLRSVAEKVYNELKSGADFSELAKKYSSDKYSSNYGGEIGWVSVNSRFPAEWLSGVFSLKSVNETTAPLKTDFGYHIIKLLEKKSREPYNAIKNDLVNFIRNSERQSELTQIKIGSLEKQLSTQTNEKTWQALMVLAGNHFPTDSTFQAQANKLNTPLLKINKDNFPVSDFIAYVKATPLKGSNLSTDYLKNSYNNYLLNKLNEEKEKNLANENPEFRNLSKEYFDGILLFDIMNKEVWLKAEQDTTGLKNFFVANRSKYTWSAPKYKGYVIHCKDSQTEEKARAIISTETGKKGLPQSLAVLNDSTTHVRIEMGTWGEGDNSYIDKQFYGKTNKKEMKGFPIFFVEARAITQPEEYVDVRGQIITDYQDLLEKQWVESLHKKYKVEVDNKILNKVK